MSEKEEWTNDLPFGKLVHEVAELQEKVKKLEKKKEEMIRHE